MYLEINYCVVRIVILPWQPDITFILDFMLLHEGYIDVSMYGFILIFFNTKDKNQNFHMKINQNNR